jgi:hypothetical protein
MDQPRITFGVLPCQTVSAWIKLYLPASMLICLVFPAFFLSRHYTAPFCRRHQDKGSPSPTSRLHSLSIARFDGDPRIAVQTCLLVVSGSAACPPIRPPESENRQSRTPCEAGLRYGPPSIPRGRKGVIRSHDGLAEAGSNRMVEATESRRASLQD